MKFNGAARRSGLSIVRHVMLRQPAPSAVAFVRRRCSPLARRRKRSMRWVLRNEKEVDTFDGVSLGLMKTKHSKRKIEMNRLFQRMLV